MFDFNLLYFEKGGRYLGNQHVNIPGHNHDAVAEFVKENYMDTNFLGVYPEYCVAVPARTSADPVLVVFKHA